MRVIIDIQNELLLKLHKLNGLIDLRALWDFAVRLDEGSDFFTKVHVIHSIIDFVKTCSPHSSEMRFLSKELKCLWLALQW